MNRQDLGMLISMSAPPEVVERVMEASCYIMGMELPTDPGTTNWNDCRKWLQNQGTDVFTIIKAFDSSELSNEQVVAAAELLSGCTIQDASRASHAAGLFFSFATGMLYDIKVRMHNNVGDGVNESASMKISNLNIVPNDIVEQGNSTIMKEATEEKMKSEGKEEVLSALQLKSWDTGVVDTGSGDTGGGDGNVVGDVKEMKKVENYE